MMGAETAAFELGTLSLEDALALVAVYGRKDDRKFDRALSAGYVGSSKNNQSCSPKHAAPATGSSNSTATKQTSRQARSVV